MKNTPIVRWAPRGVVMAAAAGLLAGGALSGCRSAPKRTAGSSYTTDAPREDRAPSMDLSGLEGGNQGAASDMVFSNPRVANYYIAIKPEVLEELRRRDHELAIYDPAPITAIENEWPTEPRPSLDEQRLIRTRTASDRTFIYYDIEPAR
ncbi:MAG: hypothetical protein RIB60_01790 [Phycisphaerales bacterium]